MSISSSFLRLLSLAILIALLAGCAAPPASTPAGTVATAPGVSAPPAATARPSASPTGARTTAAPAGSPLASPAPDLRLPPEQWQQWPVVPAATPSGVTPSGVTPTGVTTRALEIYALGQTLGNDPRHFSKIGDCQSIKEALMGMFDRPGYYRLDKSQQYLDEAIAHFGGSFNRDGNAVQGGFNAASVLSPMWANPATCQAGENPLECEYRVHKPAFAIISLEVWWNGRTPERYEQYMRRIIEYAAAHGVVPILSTKADNVEGDNSINLATARLAYEYNLPLWNWWRAAQELPNGGLDPTRPDGFHLSDEAWLPRSVTALQALDAVWRGVTSQTGGADQIARPERGDTPEPGRGDTSEPGRSDTPAAPLQTTGTVTPFTPGKLAGWALVSLAERKDEALHPLGVYRIDLNSGAKEQVGADGDALQDQSADGRLLIRNGGDLFTSAADGSGRVKISSTLAQVEATAAVWLADGGVAYLSDLNGQTALVIDQLDGAGWTRLTPADTQPRELFPTPDAERVYWAGTDGVFVTTLQGVTTPLEGVKRPVFSPLPPQMVFVRAKSEDASLLVLSQTDGSGQREAPIPGDLVLDAAWSPDGQRLSVLLLNRSEYSGRMGSVNHFLFTPADFGTRELPRASGLSPRSIWSPDGQQVLVAGTDALESGYRVYARVIDASTLSAVELTVPMAAHSPDLILVTGLAWGR